MILGWLAGRLVAFAALVGRIGAAIVASDPGWDSARYDADQAVDPVRDGRRCRADSEGGGA